MKVNYRELEYDKFVQIFNIEGKVAAREFVSNNTNIKYNYFVKLLRKHTKYIYNRLLKKYELSNDESDTFLSMDDLIKKNKDDATTIVASLPEKVYYKEPLNDLYIDIFQDRLLELSKYITISQSAKNIKINLHRLRESGYDIDIIQ